MTSVDEIILAAEQLPVAIWMGRVPSGEVVYTNATFREVLGIEPPPGAARGAFVEPYGVHERDGSVYPEEKMPFERVIRARATVVVDDLVIHRRDGHKVYLRVFAKPLFDAAGEMTHVLEAFTDITREVEADAARVEGEKRLALAQRLESIGQLVAGIAHDFNNLLTVTKLVTGRLLGSEVDASKRAALSDVELVTDSAITLIRNLLEFAGRSRSSRELVDVGGVVASVARIAQRTFERRLTVKVALHAEDARVMGDRSQLEQVLMNLLVNARDAIAGQGEIVLETKRARLDGHAVPGCAPGDYVVAEVRDTGPGMEPHVRERVFEPYFTTKELGPIKGTGLGLATVHGIVRTHGGFVEVADTGPHGTTMRVAFPEASAAERAQARPALGPESVRAPVSTKSELVLLVEDERLVREAASVALTELGYRVLQAENGAQAFELFRQHHGDLAAVVLDMVMPDVSARELHSRMRSVAPSVPVLVVTGSSAADEMEALLAEGVRAWLPKPFAIEEFVAVLRRITSSHA